MVSTKAKKLTFKDSFCYGIQSKVCTPEQKEFSKYICWKEINNDCLHLLDEGVSNALGVWCCFHGNKVSQIDLTKRKYWYIMLEFQTCSYFRSHKKYDKYD